MYRVIYQSRDEVRDGSNACQVQRVENSGEPRRADKRTGLPKIKGNFDGSLAGGFNQVHRTFLGSNDLGATGSVTGILGFAATGVEAIYWLYTQLLADPHLIITAIPPGCNRLFSRREGCTNWRFTGDGSMSFRPTRGIPLPLPRRDACGMTDALLCHPVGVSLPHCAPQRDACGMTKYTALSPLGQGRSI